MPRKLHLLGQVEGFLGSLPDRWELRRHLGYLSFGDEKLEQRYIDASFSVVPEELNPQVVNVVSAHVITGLYGFYCGGIRTFMKVRPGAE